MKNELVQRLISGIILAVAVLYITYWHPISFAVMCVIGAWILWREWRALTRTRGPLFAVGGIIYIGTAIASLIALRFFDEGMYIIFFLFALVWAGDIGGYVVGKLSGKHKIAPSISPGKSWEGLTGSVFATALVLYLFSDSQHILWPWWIYIAIGALISVIGLAGDLFESALKRRAGVKDSGTLIPGHGGLFDRVDALMPVAILFGILYFVLPALAGI